MQKLQDSVFSVLKTTNLSPAVFSFLQPSDDHGDTTPLGGIFEDTKHGWLALGPKFCVVDLRTGLKVAARTFGASASSNTIVTSVIELPKPLTENSQQLVISLQCDDIGMICILHVNGSQLLQCMQTEVVVTKLAVCDMITDGPFTCFDGLIMAGTARGEIFVFDLNKSSLIQALKDISQGYEHLVQNEANPTNLSFLPLNAIDRIEEQRELALENDHHLAVLLNESSMVDGQYIFRNPDGTVRMKAKTNHIRVTVLEFIPQVGSLAVGFNFGAFQIWNMITLDLEFTSQVNMECLPVTHFAFQEPCDDPRAFCYLWAIFSVIDKYEEEEFPLAVMYSLTYQGKRMLSDTQYLYQDFLTASIRFQIELGSLEDDPLLGGKCIACHSYSIKSTLGDEAEDNMLNICQLVWECWGENANTSTQYGMLLFDLDQWYKDQMPACHALESGAFVSVSRAAACGGAAALHARLQRATLAPYSHPTRLDEHFYPNSLQYNCVFLNTSEVLVLHTPGIQRQIIGALSECGPAALLHPHRLHAAATRAGLPPLHRHRDNTEEEQRKYLLSVALEARLSQFLKRCAHDWATGTHSGVGCTLDFLVDWAWQRAIELKEAAKDLTAPLFVSSALPDRNVVRSLEHCVQQLTQLTGLMDAILTKCCNLVVPDALSEMEERQAGIGAVSLYFQVVQWFLRVGLLPERASLPYPGVELTDTYCQRRVKLNRLQENSNPEENAKKSCSLLYIDQLIEHEFGGDRIHQMWIKGGSVIQGLYPPPSLYSLLRLYLLPDIAEEHKHSLVLYLLVDYSMVYDDVRYETVIRRLMQFPTMFGLSNTAIKATQAFWHLDHRDFDFALDQLQCLTGNTLHEWQHNVVLSSLLAQKKTQAALQYLHVRKPAPLNCGKDDGNNYTHRLNDHDKLEDWQSCCNLYLARGLLFEALDVIRMCVQNANTLAEKTHMLQFFFKGCRNSGNLSKILQVTLLPLEEEVFIKYLENCNECQTSDLLIMYYLQQARYLEAERYNGKLKQCKPQRNKDMSASAESVYEEAAREASREAARDCLVQVMCAAVPAIASTVAHCARDWKDFDSHVNAPKPMSVFVQAKSPKNTFTYKSTFIQDTIENASETWMNKPKMRKGLKRAFSIEETPFICTPKLVKHRSIFTEQQESESTPPKRSRLDVSNSNTPKTPKGFKLSEKLTGQMDKLLEMPEMQSPIHLYNDRTDTPHSILKMRSMSRDNMASPTIIDESDDDLETASCHTHFSDTTNKHLRFTIPTASEGGSTPSPIPASYTYNDLPEEGFLRTLEREQAISALREKEMDISTSDSYVTTTSHAMNEVHPLESPPKKLAVEPNIQPRKSYRDTVRGRRSLSISANSSLSDDPNTSIESIADIPITLINPRYSGEKKQRQTNRQSVTPDKSDKEQDVYSIRDIETTKEYKPVDVKGKTIEVSLSKLEVPRTPRGRRGIRSIGESTPMANRSRSTTPERQDSPITTPLRTTRSIRSRSKTPELSPRSSPLASIPEQTKEETECEPHPEKTTLTVPRLLRRSKTPERADKGVSESPRLEVIKESPTKLSGTESSSSPSRRSLRSRSSTPEVEVISEPIPKPSPRSLRSRSKTPEKLLSPKKDHSVRTKKSLSRIVLEANTFAKTKQTLETLETEITESRTDANIECTPMKTLKQVSSLMDVTLSPIVNKSVLQSSTDSAMSDTVGNVAKSDDASELGLKTLPAFTTIHETYLEKSVLRSYQSSVAESSQSIREEIEKPTEKTVESKILRPLPDFTTLNEADFNKSVLHSYESSVAETSSIQKPTEEKQDQILPKPFTAFASMIETDFDRSVLHSHQSSVAQSPDVSDAQNVNTSSLITNDSDVEMKEESENQDKAVQKEKEKIVEIVREINEIEGDMSNDSDREDSERSLESAEGSENDNSEGSLDESDTSTSESGESTSMSSDDDNDEGDEDDEIISIGDSDSEDCASKKQPTKISNIDMQPEEKVDKMDLTEKVEGSLDPLNQAQISLLTDDNSVIESEPSISLNYSEEKVEKTVQESKIEQPKVPEVQSTLVQFRIVMDNTDYRNETAIEKSKANTENMDVVDTSASASELKETLELKVTEVIQTKLNNEINEKKIDVQQQEMGKELTKSEHNVVEKPQKISKSDEKLDSTKTKDTSVQATKAEQGIEIMETDKSSETKDQPIPATNTENYDLMETDKPSESEDTTDKQQKESTDKAGPQTSSNKSIKETQFEELKEKAASKESETQESELRTPRTRRRANSNASTKSKGEPIEPSTEIKDTNEREKHQEASVFKEIELKESEEPKTPVTRRRANSRSSTQSKNEAEESAKEMEEPKEAQDKSQQVEEPKTPATRKRSQSNASKQSEENTPEDTPSRRRARTPTSAEVRKIITRRISREMAGKLDDSNQSLEDVASLTPKRRTTRARSKNLDDNESVASESSVVSNRSKASEESELKTKKGRKSVLATKPDLSVIPEVIAEDDRLGLLAEYTGVRRLTRHQKAILEGHPSPRVSRRASNASSVASEIDEPFNVQPIDRISLMNKTDFDGPPDSDELQNDMMSPESIASDASKMRRSRMNRAASESKTVVRAAKINRRNASVDVAETSSTSSPVGADSPARGRRASFNRACEALLTPKGRRASTDLRKGETDSQTESPAVSEPETPARRSRRVSTHSNTSLTKSDTGKRTTKMPVLPEDKEHNK